MAYGPRAALLRRRRGVAGFSPASLFASGAPGDYGSADDLARLWQDTAGTSPVTTSGQTAARQDGARGVISLQQATAASRPAYTASGGLHHLAFDGVDDGFASAAALDLTATDKVTAIFGVHKTSDAAAGMLVEMSVDQAAAGTFYITAPESGTVRYAALGKGSATVAGVHLASITASGAAPDTAVLTAALDIAGDLNRIRRNGVAGADATGDQGTGNYGSHTLYMGRRGGASVPFNGRIYAWIIIGRALTASELAQAEAWVASKTGVTL